MSADSAGSGSFGWDPFRVLTVGSALLVALSYLLPWADVEGPAREIQDGMTEINLSAEGFEGSVPAYDISLFPELVLGTAAVALLVAVFRWTIFGQFLVGVLGLGASYITLVMWAVIDADGEGELVEIGSYAGLPSSFEPAVGLWLAMAGTLALVFCGFGGATREYVRRTKSEE